MHNFALIPGAASCAFIRTAIPSLVRALGIAVVALALPVVSLAQTLVSVTAQDATASETPGDGGRFVITLSAPNASGSTLTVFYTPGGSATASTDYVVLGAAEIPAGSSSVSIDVTPLDDAVQEPVETVEITLTGTSDPLVTVGTPNTAIVSITDNDEPLPVPVSIVASDPTAGETSADTGEFTVGRGGDPAQPLTVSYSISDSATAGVDYISLPGSVTFGAGESEVAITVTVPGNDDSLEGDETVTITLVEEPGVIDVVQGTATVTILDSPHSVTVTKVADASESSPSPGQFSVSLGAVNASASALTVQYDDAGSASSGADYQALSGTAVIPVGSSSVPIDVVPVNDNVEEPTETVDITLTLTSNSAVTVGSPATASLSIADDDEPLPVMVSVTALGATASETPAGNGEFVVSRVGGDMTRPVTVAYAVTGTASPGEDYTSLSGSVDLESGESEASIAVIVAGNDGAFEGDETVTITLTEVAGEVDVVQGTATVTINDSPHSVTVTTVLDTSENSLGPGRFSVSLGARNASASALTVQYGVAGSATAGTDYQALDGVAAIPVGSNSVTIDVTPVDDDDQEPDETVSITLTSTNNAAVTIGTPATAELTIADDEPIAVIVSVAAEDANAGETPPSNGQFVIRRSGGDPDRPVTIDYSVAGSASNADDYAVLPGSVDLGTGETAVAIAVTVTGDDQVFEGDETVTITLVEETGVVDVLDGGATATVTIADSPHSVTVSSASNASENPASAGQFIVSLGAQNASGAALDLQYDIAGSATPGTDYQPLSGTAAIPVGATSVPVAVTPIDDTVLEGEETVEITLTATDDPRAPVGTPATASLSIAEDDADDDGDGLRNVDECQNPLQCPDTDQDGLTDDQDPDDDGDGIPTADEDAPARDTDGDATANYLDNDDDGDGRLTGDEDTNADGDGNPATDPGDADDDGVPDYLDALDHDGPAGDADGDGLSNAREQELGTDPVLADTDGDGVEDGDEDTAGSDPLDELSFADADGDLVPDAVEIADDSDPDDPESFADGDFGTTADYIEMTLYPAFGIASTSIADANDDRRDFDGDGLPDRLELSIGAEPSASNSPTANGAGDDNDNGVSNALEAYLATLRVAAVDAVSDRDRDGYPDVAEVTLGLHPLRANEPDIDGDGVPDIVEVIAGIDIVAPTDSDGDGVPDAREIGLGTDFLDANSPVTNGAMDGDSDRVSNAIEETLRILGASEDIDDNSDGDGDGIGDADEIRFGTDPFRDDQPVPWVEIAQADLGPVNALVTDGGKATITAVVGGHQTGLLYDWSESSNAILAVSSGGTSNSTLTISPQTLPPGPYILAVNVARTAGAYSSPVSAVKHAVTVLAGVAAAQVADADNDGVPDRADGADAREGLGNELKVQSGARIQTEPGIRLQLGSTARIARTDSARVTLENIAGAGNGSGGSVGNSADDFDYLSGIYDFEITNLPEVGAIVQVVIPQAAAIGEFPEYRKFEPAPGWVGFVEDANNSVASAAGIMGACPAPGDDSFAPGLTAGHSCVQLTLEDGGPNDGDAALGPNGLITDPGGVATPKGQVTVGQGSGSLGPLALMVLGFVVLLSVQRRFAASTLSRIPRRP